MVSFTQIARNASPSGHGRVRTIKIRLFVSDCAGTVYFTDVMLQGGSIATGWVGHVSEIRWTMDG